jgi:hemin uptake protein HemP
MHTKSVSHLPQPWRPNALYQRGDRVTIRDEGSVYVLRCERWGKGGLRPPKMPRTMITCEIAHQHKIAIVRLYDGECEWWLERAVRRTLGA